VAQALLQDMGKAGLECSASNLIVSPDLIVANKLYPKVTADAVKTGRKNEKISAIQ
jgi:hypothetical protein